MQQAQTWYEKDTLGVGVRLPSQPWATAHRGISAFYNGSDTA